jgi:hypothetical protein
LTGLGFGVLSVIAAVYMANMLGRHTGKGLLEKHMARSTGGAYADYARRTAASCRGRREGPRS